MFSRKINSFSLKGGLLCFSCMLISYLVIFPIAKLLLRKIEWYEKAVQSLRTKGRANIGGFTFTSGGSRSPWSSGSSSGFSGGGVSSGGGDSSGSW